MCKLRLCGQVLALNQNFEPSSPAFPEVSCIEFALPKILIDRSQQFWEQNTKLPNAKKPGWTTHTRVWALSMLGVTFTILTSWKVDKGLTRLMMALLVDPWACKTVEGSPRLTTAFGNRFWPCQTVDGLRRSLLALWDSWWPSEIFFWPSATFFGLVRLLLASGDLFWPSNISSGLCRSFLALYDVLAVFNF